MNTLTILLGCWGIDTKRGDQYYISGFWFMLMSLITVLRGKKVKFNVTPKDATYNPSLKHVIPHLVIISLSVLGILYNVLLLVKGYHPAPSGFAANTFWTLFNLSSLLIMVRAAFWRERSASPVPA